MWILFAPSIVAFIIIALVLNHDAWVGGKTWKR
jgi:hypothetical protein